MQRKLVALAVLGVSVLGSSTALAVAADMRHRAMARGTRVDAQSVRITLDQGTLSAMQDDWDVSAVVPPSAPRVWRTPEPAQIEDAVAPRDIDQMRCVWRPLSGGTEGTGVQVCE